MVFRRLIPCILSVAGASFLYYLSGIYPKYPLYELSLSIGAIVSVYILIIVFLNGVLFRHIPDEKTRYTMKKVSTILALIIIGIFFIRIWVADTPSLIVSLGVVGAGIGIALQDVIRNFVGGLIVITTRLYEVGDRIEIAGETGDVIDIGVMTTTLFETGGWVGGDQPSGRVTLIPNGKVITQQVHNYTKDHSFIWDELTIPISYDSDWKQAREIILEIIRREAAENTKQAETEIDRLGEKYYFPGKNLEPSVYITPTDNGLHFRSVMSRR